MTDYKAFAKHLYDAFTGANTLIPCLTNVNSQQVRGAYEQFKRQEGVPPHIPVDDVQRIEFDVQYIGIDAYCDALLARFPHVRDLPHMVRYIIQNITRP